MKLLFEKKDTQTVSVKIDCEGTIQDFKYITMLKGLLEYGPLDNSDLIGNFSDAERNSIDSMVKGLNDCLPTKIVTGSHSDEKDVKPETGTES